MNTPLRSIVTNAGNVEPFDVMELQARVKALEQRNATQALTIHNKREAWFAEKTRADAAEARVKALEAERDRLKVVLWDMQHGPDCWCEVAIGNPMYRDHSPACKQARAALLSPEEAPQ